MKRIIPFQQELADILEQRMQAVGLEAKSSKPVDIIIQYLTVLKRIVKPIPREVLVSDVFSCPEEQQAGWEKFKSKVETGKDINRHQSTTMKKKGYTDLMLSAWQIYHFHLGETTLPSGYAERKGEILYAMIKGDKFLALKFDEHGHWSDKDLLNIAHRNWPDLTSDWDVEGTPEVDLSSDDIGKLRKSGVNIMVRREDGTSTIGGYGITTAGTSAEATLSMIEINRRLENAYNDAIAEFGNTPLEIGFDVYNNICVVEPKTMKGVLACNVPDISQYAYLFKS